MRTTTKLVRLCAVVPAAIAGSFVAIMGLGFLPDAGLVLAFAGLLVVALVLACGRWEGPASRVLGFARAPRPGQQAVLEPTLSLLQALGLSPGRLLIRVEGDAGMPASPIGRRTVIVQPWLVRGLYQRGLRAEDAAAAIGHAVASQRLGPSRFDLAARLWALPWTLVLAVVRRIAAIFSWVPAGGLAWHLRVVVGVVVVVQAFQPGGNRALGVAVGVLVAVSYIAPEADRTWRSMVRRDADRVVAQRGLAASLVQLAQWEHGPGSSASLERVQRIRAAAEAKPADAKAGPGSGPSSGPETGVPRGSRPGGPTGITPAASRPDLAWPRREHLQLIDGVQDG